MKKILSAALMLMASSALFAQKAVITGKFSGFDTEKNQVSLANATNLRNMTPAKVNQDGTFTWEIDVKDGARYYFILEEPHTGGIFYVEPGMKADLQISFRQVSENNQERTVCDVVYTGDNKDCYDFVQGQGFYEAQSKVVGNHYQKNDVNFNDFRAEFRYELDKILAKVNAIGTPTFRKYMKEDFEKKFSNGLSWFMYCSEQTDSVFDAYMATIDRNDPSDIQSASSYATYVKQYLAPKGEDGLLFLLQNMKKYYSDPAIINAVATENVMGAMAKAPANIEDIYKAYVAVVGTPSPAAEAAYNKYKAFVPGAPGFNFTMTDTKGKKVKFSQLKGKAVYFDMWATWCGPCCAEIPYMEKLAAHYKGDKRIQIISVSLDKNKKAWENKIAKDKPQWAQYIMPDNFESDLCKAYDITGIPRFMMFDKNGKIISIDAPRPSSETIIKWIENNLK